MTRPTARSTLTGWCEVMEMDRAGCAHCRPPVPHPPVRADHPWRGNRPFVARYGSRCPACNANILADLDMIVRNADGQYVHQECDE